MAVPVAMGSEANEARLTLEDVDTHRSRDAEPGVGSGWTEAASHRIPAASAVRDPCTTSLCEVCWVWPHKTFGRNFRS